MSGATIIRVCATVNEAVIVTALLRDGGFEATIDNYQHASLNWGMIPALGGVYVRVPHVQLMDAGLYMIDAVSSAHQRFDETTDEVFMAADKRRYLRAWFILLIWSGFPILAEFTLILPLLLFLATIVEFLPIAELSAINLHTYLLAMFREYAAHAYLL